MSEQNDVGHRILVIAHGHPDFSLGGAEIAAYHLFHAYRDSPAVEAAWFLARADRGRGATGSIGLRREGEYLWEQGIGDWHLLSTAHRESMVGGFTELLKALRPTAVHVHHYAHFGLEMLRAIKLVDPGIRLLLTLHEYMAICRNDGQMVKTGDRGLCHSSSIDDCQRCFPEHSIEDFWLRRQRVLGYFQEVDSFIAPSRFLAERYLDWGLPTERVHVIENCHPPRERLPPRELRDAETRSHFGYFGQIHPYKGLHVLLEALASMVRDGNCPCTLEINGANIEQQTDVYQRRIKSLVSDLEAEGVVHWRGPYAPTDMASRMASIDWVVVPSVWWENSPMVIQEAFGFGRPVLCSDLGGMSEKVQGDVDGYLIEPNDIQSWVRGMNRASNGKDWERMRGAIRKAVSHEQCAARHIRIIECIGQGQFKREAPEGAAVVT